MRRHGCQPLSPHLLPDDQLTRDNCKEYLSRFLAWLHERFDAGDNIIELVATRPNTWTR